MVWTADERFFFVQFDNSQELHLYARYTSDNFQRAKPDEVEALLAGTRQDQSFATKFMNYTRSAHKSEQHRSYLKADQ